MAFKHNRSVNKERDKCFIYQATDNLPLHLEFASTHPLINDPLASRCLDQRHFDDLTVMHVRKISFKGYCERDRI